MDKLYTTNTFTDSLQSTATAEANFISIDLSEKDAADIHATKAAASYLTNVYSPLDNKWNQGIKTFFDITVSCFLIITILSWLVPLLALLIKLDSRGPVFFLQNRTGAGGRIFRCIKLRSMYCNDDAHTLAAQENDQRITRLGTFLRKYHLDELPQLFNVLAGDMSLVGPRPHMLQENLENEKRIADYSLRHAIKPGITGLAQSLGNFGATYDIQNLKERTAYDIQYIHNWSFRGDLIILFRTIRMMAGFK